MDVFDENLLAFWRSLQQNNVQYILIGEFAMYFHGFKRFSGDMDIWLKATLQNRKALRNTFIDCDMGDYPMLESMQFIAGWTEFHLNNGLTLDILTEMKGLEDYTFDECLQIASIADIDGVNIPFLHINQLIKNKQVIDRPKDRIDIIALEKLRKLRESE